MKIKEITYPTALEQIENPLDDNIDIFVDLDDGYCYTLVVITPSNILKLIETGNNSYLECGPPLIIVKELKEEVIYAAIESYLDNDAYWLKEYYLSGDFDIKLLNKMMKELKENYDD